MSSVIQSFITELSPKVLGILKGTAKLVIDNEGEVYLNDQGAFAEGGDVDVSLIAKESVFRAILDGTQNPTMAFMTGKLKVEGSATRALKVSDILTK